MKISNETLTILKNFSSINSGIFVKQGNVLSTVSPQKNILADAVVSETFPLDFGIFDLNNFLSVISLFKDDAELDFDSKHVVVTGMGGRSKIKYRFTDPSMLIVSPDKRPNLPSVDVKFTLTEEDFNWILKTASVLGAPHVAVESDGSIVSLVAFDANNDASHVNSLSLSNASADGKTYKLVFKSENLKMLPGNYEVEISSKGISKFVDTNKNITYYATLETCSKYE
jgi:gp45 sliding clamp, C terminal